MENAILVGAAAVVGGLIGQSRKEGFLTGALLGGAGATLGVIMFGRGSGGEHRVGQLPQSLPTPGLPGQLVYNQDPRTDAMLDPVSRQRLYPAWLLLHWQNGDRKVIVDVQRVLGVPADGVPGGATSAAIQAYQAHNGLPATGVMDRMTMEALILG